MQRQMRNLYIRSNKLLRTFHFCSTGVKLELFIIKLLNSILMLLFMESIQKKTTFAGDAASVRSMYANFGMNNFETTIRVVVVVY